MKLRWVNAIEIVWLVASLYLGSQLTYWLGSSFFEHAFAIIAVASPVWLARLLIMVEKRRIVLIGAAAAYAVAAAAVAPTFNVWAIRNETWIPIACAAVFAGLLFMHDRARSRSLIRG